MSACHCLFGWQIDFSFYLQLWQRKVRAIFPCSVKNMCSIEMFHDYKSFCCAQSILLWNYSKLLFDCCWVWFNGLIKNSVNVSDLCSLKYFSFMKLLCNISSIFSSLFAGISASLSLSSLGSPTGSEPSSLRARHGSHHQSRRTSFHRKSRKHSGSFDWGDCFKCIFNGLYYSIFWHPNFFKPNLPTLTSNSDNLLPDFCSPKYPWWNQFFGYLLCVGCPVVIFLYCCL